MPSTPTTKSQVQAYRFVLRRMQSALVRRDSVMLHDPMRTHGRATMVGVIIAALGLVGFVIFGLISPSPSVPSAPGIVIGKQSGTIYVVSGNPVSLTPTFNLASARLLLMSQSQGGASAPADAEVVPDDSLKDIPHNRRTGIVDGPQLLPSADQRIDDNWAVCDQVIVNKNLPQSIQLQQSTSETTVLAGVSGLGTALSEDQAILAAADNGKYYLIYKTAASDDPNNPTPNTVRAEVDPTQQAVVSTFHLNGAPRRHISTGLLNAIPQVSPLVPPTIPDIGGTSGFAQLQAEGLKNGNVFAVNSVSGSRDVYVLLPTGIQKVSDAVGDLIRAAQSGSTNIPQVSPNEINNVRIIQPNDADALPVGSMPAQVPTILDPTVSTSACLGWTVQDNKPQTTVYVGSATPVPSGAKPVDVNQPGPNGLKVDKFYMPPGRGAVVQSATSADTFGKGPMSLVTDNGLRYGIPDANTLKGLGLDNPAPRPAPESIISLLPTGTSLNTVDTAKSYDDIPVAANAGTYPSVQPSQSSSAGTTGSSGN